MNNAPTPAGGLLRTSILYAVGDFVTKGARIILVPYYLASFSQAELGQLAILTVIGAATWILSAFGLGMTIQRQYFDYGDGADAFVGSVWWARLIGGLPVLGILLAGGWLYHQFALQSIPFHWVALAICAGYLRGGMNLIESWFIAREEPLRYRTFTFFQFLTITALIIGLVSGLKLGVAGAVYGELLGYVLWTGIAATLLSKAARPTFSSVHWGNVLTYSLPVIPHALFMWGLAGVDRLVLKQLDVPLDQIGIYDVAYQLATYLSIVTLALRAAWLPKYFKSQAASGDPQQTAGYSKTLSLYINVVCAATLCGWMLAPEGFAILLGEDFGQHLSVFRIVLFGNLAMGFFSAFNVPLLSERRTDILAVISGLGLAMNIGLNFWLIPEHGTLGAAWATLVAYLGMAVAMFIVIDRRYHITWEFSHLIVGPSLAVICMASTIGTMQAWSWSLPVRVGLIVLFALFVALPRLRKRFGKTKTSSSTVQANLIVNEVQK